MKKQIPQLIRLRPASLLLAALLLLIAVTLQAAPVTSNTTGNWSATAWPNTSRTGTITSSTLSSNITGSGTSFTTEISVGNIIKTFGSVAIGTVASITDNTHLILTSNALSTNGPISFRSQGVGPVDAATIANGSTLTVDGTFTCASLTFAVVSSNTTLTISGINSLNVTGSVSMPRPSLNTCTISVGAGYFAAGSFTMNSTTSGKNDILSISTGTVNITGAITTGTTGCQITFTNAGTFNFGGSFSGSPSITQFAGNTWNYNGSAQTVLGISYYNLTLSGTGIKIISGVTVNGILSMEGTATASANPTYGPSSTLQYNTSTARIAGPELISGFSATGGVVITNTGIITLNSDIVVNAPVIINNAASLSTGSGKNYALTFGDNFINNGTLTAYSSPISISGTGNQSISGFTTTGSVSMIKTAGSATLTGNVNGGSLAANGSGGTLNLGTGLVHTFTGTWTNTAGTITGGSSTLIIGGNVTNTGGTFTPGTGTVNYNGTSAPQITGSSNYYNLILSGAGAKTLQSGSNSISNDLTLSGTASFTAVIKMTIGGSVTIGSGTTFNSSAFIHNLAGNWTNNGTFTPGAGGLNFNGTINQVIGGTGLNTFNNLTISNTSGVSLAGNVTVNGTLIFTNGKISTGAYSFLLGNSAVVSGAGSGKYIFGNLVMGIPAATNMKTFEIGDAAVYTPVTLSFTGTTNGSGSISLNTVAGNSPNISTSNINPLLSVNRYWTISNNAVTGFTSYDATFNYVAGDIDAGADYSSFIAGVYSSSSWSYPTVGTTSAASIQITGLTAFGQFQTGESGTITATSYGNNGSTPIVADVVPCINIPSDPIAISSVFTVHQYFTMNVIKGLTYEVYSCNSTSPSNPLMMVVYKEGAPTDPYVAFSTSNTGNPCSSIANNVYLSFIPAFSGEVRVLVNRKGNSNSITPSGLTIKINVSGGANSLDDQTAASSDSWVGHIYDGMSFNNYLGYYLIGSETIQETFGTGGTWPNNNNDDATCFNLLSGGIVRGSVLDVNFSVRYRMNSTKRGLYTATLTSDDGTRLIVDNNTIYSNWSDHSPMIVANVLFPLSGSSSLAFEYYENGGQNVAGFSNLVQIFSNTLTQNLNQQLPLNTGGSAIIGDIYGTLPTGITLSGTGYQWAYSNSSSAGPWTDITGATNAVFTPSATGSPFNTAGTYYLIRKAVLSGTNNISPNPYIATSVSNYATITILPVAGTWLGTTSNDWHTSSNWSGGVPTSITDVIIPSGTTFQPTVNSDIASCRNITINTGSTLTISATRQVNVSGTITNNAGSDGLVLQSNSSGTASLIHNTNNVAATVNRYITGNSEAWHFLSSPVANQNITGTWLPSGTYGNGTGYDLYVWDEASSCWIYKLNTTSVKNWNTVHPQSNFIAGRGYLYSVQAGNPTKQFKGNLNNGNLTIPITSSSTNVNLSGFNLVGNPYPSAVDWQSSTGWTRSDLYSSGGGYDMWIWNPAALNYGVINSSGGTGTNGVTRYVAAMQGFFIRAKVNGNLGITNSVRVQQGTVSWFKKGTGSELNKVSVTINSETGTGYDEVQLVFGSEKNESGAMKLFSPVTTAPSIYLPFDSENLSLRYLTDTVDNPIVPIVFKPGTDGLYTLQCNIEFNQLDNVILEDRQVNKFQDIKSESAYRFKSSKTDNPNRFFLHFTSVKKSVSTELPISVYATNNKLVIDLTRVTLKNEVMVSDMMGRILVKTTLEGESIHELTLNSKPQVLIVLIKNQMETVCRKVMWVNN